MMSDEQGSLEETIKSTSPILWNAGGMERGGDYRLRFSFRAAARFVRWITLYFHPHSQFSPRKLGTHRFSGSEEDMTKLEGDFFLSIEPPGVLRVLVSYEGFGLWEYTREID